jgi:uncharacterized protein (TIGR03437 family)
MSRSLSRYCCVLLAMSVRAQPEPASRFPMADRLSVLPLTFEPNQGQIDGSVQYLSRAPGYTLLLTTREVALAGSGSPVLRMKLVGANRQARIEGLDRLPGISNYFLGNNPAKWRTRIPNYRKVALREIYPGIDLVFYGNRGELEYDWVVAPGADPKQIRVKLEGAEGMRTEPNGDLVLNTAVWQRKPVVYQMVEGRRKEIDGGYSVRGQEVAFHVASYDARSPLVIDPALMYSIFLGGSSGSNTAQGVAVDAAGNAYVAGSTASTNFPTLNALKSTLNPGASNAFVTKISAGGTLLYSTFMGGLTGAQALGVGVDGAGNAYVAGVAGSADFPTVDPMQSRNSTSFVAKISPDGSKLVYSTFLGGSSGGDQSLAIAVDSGGNAYVTGVTQSSDFPTVNAMQPTFGGVLDAFVAKINPAGSALVYSTYLGGSRLDHGAAIAVDPDGNAYIAGYTDSNDFPIANALQSKYAGGPPFTGFVTKLGADGSMVYSTYFGGKPPSNEGAWSVAADTAGNAYVEGDTSSPDFPTAPNGPPGSINNRMYVTRINPTGSAFVYTVYLQGAAASNSSGKLSGIAVDLAGNAYVTGLAYNTSFPTTGDALQGTLSGPNSGFNDGFLTKFSTTGSILYSNYLGGSDGASPTGIAVRGSDAYLVGYTTSTFPTAGPPSPGNPGSYPAFAVRIAGEGPQPAAVVNSASGLPGPIAPGEWITIAGAQLGPPEGASYIVNGSGSVDSNLAGVQVLFDTIPGTPAYVSDGLINVVAPYEIAGRASTNISVIYQQAVSPPIPQAVAAVSPAFYGVTNADGTKNGPAGSDAEPAPQGSVISVYGTGGGQTDPPSATGSVSPVTPLVPLANSVTATIGGQSAAVMFAGASPDELTGVFRLDIQTPAGVTGDALPIVIAIGGVSSPPGPTIAVR